MTAIAVTLLLASSGASAAAETIYYRDKPWEIVLHASDDPAAGSSYCAYRTTLWNDRALSVEFGLQPDDSLGVSLRLKKPGWNLPVGQSTDVTLEWIPGYGAAFRAKAISAEELSYTLSTTSVDSSDLAIRTYLREALSKQARFSLTVIFAGNEPQWTIPSLRLFDIYQLDQALNRCQLDLRGLPRTRKGDGAATSPFGQGSGVHSTGSADKQNDDMTTDQSLSRSAPSLPSNTASADWRSFSEMEDWGKACIVETSVGKAKLGFMGSPGMPIIGFVADAYNGPVSVSWQVDANEPFTSSGEADDYFGWHTFDSLPEKIVGEVARGKQLTLTERIGKRITISLSGAGDGVKSFGQCLGKAIN